MIFLPCTLESPNLRVGPAGKHLFTPKGQAALQARRESDCSPGHRHDLILLSYAGEGHYVDIIRFQDYQGCFTRKVRGVVIWIF